jgi:hypothetical protein
MKKADAIALIQRQRRVWRSQDSDDAIARRGERVYRIAAIIMIITGAAEWLIAAAFKRPVFGIPAGGFLISAAVLLWHSRRFTRALRSLANSNARTDLH